MIQNGGLRTQRFLPIKAFLFLISDNIKMIREDFLTKVEWACVHFGTQAELEKTLPELEKHDLLILHSDFSQLYTLDDMYDEIARIFQFPDYFGRNGDALDECLRDLSSWLPANGYIWFVYNTDHLWKENTLMIGELVSHWLFCAEDWSKENIPFHLAFVVPDTKFC